MISRRDLYSQLRPWHHVGSHTAWFVPGDTRDEWLANMSNHKRRRYLVQQGWDHEQAIEYRYNRDGFRGSDFDVSRPGIMTLGCSFTFGVGLGEAQVWPWLVAQNLNVPCYNLAWGGGSSDRCRRMENK